MTCSTTPSRPADATRATSTPGAEGLGDPPEPVGGQRGAEREELLASLEELASWYRDLVVVAAGAEAAIVHADRLDLLLADGTQLHRSMMSYFDSHGIKPRIGLYWDNDDVAVEDSLYTAGRRGVAGRHDDRVAAG